MILCENSVRSFAEDKSRNSGTLIFGHTTLTDAGPQLLIGNTYTYTYNYTYIYTFSYTFTYTYTYTY